MENDDRIGCVYLVHSTTILLKQNERYSVQNYILIRLIKNTRKTQMYNL